MLLIFSQNIPMFFIPRYAHNSAFIAFCIVFSYFSSEVFRCAVSLGFLLYKGFITALFVSNSFYGDHVLYDINGVLTPADPKTEDFVYIANQIHFVYPVLWCNHSRFS